LLSTIIIFQKIHYAKEIKENNFKNLLKNNMSIQTFFQTVAERIRNSFQNLFSSPLSTALSIIVFFCIIFYVGRSSIGFTKMAIDIDSSLKKADCIRDSMVHVNANYNSSTKALANQYFYIDQYKQQHIRVAKTFEIYYYSFTLILIIASLISTILGVLIARTGWENQSAKMKAAFMGFFFSASLTGIFINVFNNSQNATNNINKYFYFNNLQTNIYEALAIDSLLPQKTKDTSLVKLFWETNKNIKENMNLFLDIKADKIPATPDINKVAGKPNTSE
jgi:predicted PurR-regulated permease PerM